MEDVAPWRTSSPSQGEARRPTKRGQLMLTHLDSSKRPSQARHVGPPGEDPSSAQARSAHADTPGQFKETLAGEARRPTKKGPQNQLPCQGSHRRRGTSAHQARLTLSKSNKQRTSSSSSSSSSSSRNNDTSHSNSICLTVKWHDMYVSHACIIIIIRKNSQLHYFCNRESGQVASR